MKVQDRQQLILNRLNEQGGCSYDELAAMLEVSGMTVRRDIEQLAKQGKVIKALGGVQKANAPVSFYESAAASRLNVNSREKQAIAQQALTYLKPQQTIFVDGSTTCLELAKLLGSKGIGLTVVTPSVLVTLALGQGSDNRIVGIGGQYDPASLSFVGPTAEDEARKFFVDVAFFSTKGFVVGEGTFESSVPNFRIKQIIAEQCHEVVLLVDHSKFGKRALCKVLDIARIHTVITDDKTSKDDLAVLRSMAKTVRVACCPESQENKTLATVS